MKAQFTFFLLGLLATSFIAIGCQKDKQSELTGDVFKDFKASMIDLAKQMIDIADGIKSVEDAEASEPKVQELMNSTATMLDKIADNMAKMSPEELAKLKDMPDPLKDPEVNEWMKKADAAVEKMQQEHPEAAAKFEEIGNKYQQQIATAMQNFLGKMMKSVMGTTDDLMEGDAAVPDQVEEGGSDDSAGK